MELIKQKKADLRTTVLLKRRALSEPQRLLESQALAAKLLALPAWQQARRVGLFANSLDEVAMDGVIDSALKDGKTVALPKVVKIPLLTEGLGEVKNQQEKLIWCTIQSLTDLEVGAFGIREPVSTAAKLEVAALDLLVVPGVAFDLAGNRLGYGKGFYDRELAEFAGLKIALVLPCQLVERVPVEAHDQKVDMVLVV